MHPLLNYGATVHADFLVTAGTKACFKNVKDSSSINTIELHNIDTSDLQVTFNHKTDLMSKFENQGSINFKLTNCNLCSQFKLLRQIDEIP